MANKNSKQVEVVPKRRWRPVWLHPIGYVLAAAVIFMAGIAFGDGRLHFSNGSGQNSQLPDRLDYSTVNTVYQQLKQHYDGKLTQTQLLNGLKAGLAEATNDPYTEYFTSAEAKTFHNQLNNSFSGIGAELGKDKDGNIIVIAPISGFPADKAGLKAQDVIININGQSTSGLGADEAVSKIRGKAGTKVSLVVIRNKTQQLNFSVTRQNITVPSVSHQIQDNNIGYIKINSFADDTASGIVSAASDLKAAGVKGIILDMRDNPGGLLDAAVTVSSQWLPQGTMVLQERAGTVVTDTREASGDDPLHGIPTVILVNAGTASAAEITAGALHDNNAAYVIGVKTFGKGVVQQLVNFDDGSQLKVTIASWYRPNGQNINHKGITPDKTVKPGTGDTAGGSDAQKSAAIEYLKAHQ